MKEIKGLRGLKPVYTILKQANRLARRQSTSIYVPPKWKDVHTGVAAKTIVAMVLEHKKHGMPLGGEALTTDDDMTSTMRDLVNKGHAKGVGTNGFKVFLGPLAGSWTREQSISPLRKNPTYWRWVTTSDFIRRVDPWAWFQAKPETREHLESVIKSLHIRQTTFQQALRWRAFVRTWLTKGAKVAVKRLLPLAHPATRRVLLKADDCQNKWDRPLIARLTLNELRFVRCAHKSRYDVMFVASRVDRNRNHPVNADEMVSRFGYEALREYELYVQEVDRLRNLHLAIPNELNTIYSLYYSRMHKPQPARLWTKWHDEVTKIIADNTRHKDSHAERARALAWAWVNEQVAQGLVKTELNIRPLITREELYQEHVEMHHCVHTYASYPGLLGHVELTKDGKTEKATFQLTDEVHLAKTFVIGQLYRECNSHASPQMKARMVEWVHQLNAVRLAEYKAQLAEKRSTYEGRAHVHS